MKYCVNIHHFYRKSSDEGVYQKYQNAMKLYKAKSIDEHIDVFEVTEMVRKRASFPIKLENLEFLANHSVRAITEALLKSRIRHYGMLIPIENLKTVTEILSKNRHRLDVVATLFEKIDFDIVF